MVCVRTGKTRSLSLSLALCVCVRARAHAYVISSFLHFLSPTQASSVPPSLPLRVGALTSERASVRAERESVPHPS
jgi:hypothetical protein